MKKHKLLTLLLTIIAMMWASNVQAQQSLEIDGEKIDLTTSADLTGPWLQSGKVSWDATTKTLTLDNAILVAKKNASNFIDIRRIGWTLRLIGSNSITTSGWVGISTVDADLKIKGGGSLKIDAQVYAISHAGADKGVTIENCTVETSKNFDGTTRYGSSLAIKQATVKFSKVENFKSISLVGCEIKVPVNGRVGTNKYGMQIIVDADGEEAESVEIEADPAINYDLSICGTKVTSANCDDLSGIDGVEGTVKYDPNTKILTLKDAKLNTGGTCIYSEVDGLTIEVSGTNEVNATNGSAIYFYSAPATITGGGTLNVKSQNRCGIFVDETNLTIKDCIVNAKGRWGIVGNSGSDEKLFIKNATVRAEGVGGSIFDFKEITLEGCAITQPAGAEFDESKKAVVLNGERVTSEVKIEPTINYDLEIAGQQVTSGNCGDLSKIDGVSGTVKYDDDTKTLTLNNATIRTTDDVAIYNMIDGLTIKVIGTNNITTERNRVIFCGRGTTFTGSGTLNVKNQTTAFVMFGAVTIDGCTMNIKGDVMGFNGTSGENLTVRNATVTAEGKVVGSIRLLTSLTLEGCAITQPVGAEFDLRQHAVTCHGEIIKSMVVITKGATGINTPTADNMLQSKRGIYTLEGVRLKGELKDLPKGVYIVDGKKVVKH